ncbi:MAG TPA: trypsin-like peptidase domain-containing protein, partial [Blastocatellia bacterium]|jgi:putative serine protease PepD|nr:trypsin-like peptidase domain-containing protein [Blastocatellia bacterium]
MKAIYQLTAKQLIALAFITAVFAASGVLIYDRLSSALVGMGAGVRNENPPVKELTDPSVATDEKNNEEVYQALSPGVVNITSTSLVRDWFEAYQSQGGSGSGSILDAQGHILTNYHVVRGANKLYADELEVSLSNNHKYKAKVIDSDPDNDLAMIKIDAPRENLTTIPLGDSKGLRVGQKVLAIGNPFGFDRTLTTGIVSGLARPIRSEMTGKLIEGAIQTDAAINPGNSGGPLLNSRGQMIGINTMILSPSGGSVGIGFAVPVDTAKRIVSDILQYGRVRKPRLGIDSLTVNATLANALDLPVNEGLMVTGLITGAAAEKAGLKGPTDEVQLGRYVIPVGGDIIVGIDGQKISTRDDLDRALNNKNVGDSVQVEVMRGKRRTTLAIQLAELPQSARQRL